MLRSKLGALVAAGAMALGLAGPAYAASPSTSTDSVVIAGHWGVYGEYPSRAQCADVGYYLVYVAGWYSNYSCSRRGSVWDLWVYDPF